MGFCFVASGQTAWAQRTKRDNKETQNSQGRAFTPRIGKIVAQAQEAFEAERWQDVLKLTQNALGKNPSDYEASVIYNIQGMAYYNLDQNLKAIESWRKTIELDKENKKQALDLRSNIGQLYLAEERYQEGLKELESWIQEGGKTNDRVFMMMAQAYAQIENFPKARTYAERAYNTTKKKERKHFDLLNYIYNKLELKAEQAKLVEEMLTLWPDDRKLWDIWLSLLAQANKEKELFEANKIMYLNGFFKNTKDIMKVVDYFNYFDVPYRSAQILSREINANRVENTAKNREKLIDLWLASREYKKAIPVLQQAVKAAPSGKLYQRMGEAYLQLRQYQQAENAFRQAIQMGGVRANDLWALIGATAYERGDRRKALDTFEKCSSTQTCRGWINFIQGEFEAEKKKEEFKKTVVREECRLTVKRLRDQAVLQGTVDEEGRIVIEVPQRCQIYFDAYGNQKPDPVEETVDSASQSEQEPETISEEAGSQDQDSSQTSQE